MKTIFYLKEHKAIETGVPIDLSKLDTTKQTILEASNSIVLIPVHAIIYIEQKKK